MHLKSVVTAGFGLLAANLLPGQAAADVKIYSYSTSANYCPAGSQPITISGVICCGTPNQSMSYQQVKSAPAPRVRRVKQRRSARPTCQIGTKGCTFD